MTTVTRSWHLLVRDALAQEFDLSSLDIMQHGPANTDDDGPYDVEIDEVIDVIANAVEVAVRHARAEAWERGRLAGGFGIFAFDNPYRDEAQR